MILGKLNRGFCIQLRALHRHEMLILNIHFWAEPRAYRLELFEYLYL